MAEQRERYEKRLDEVRAEYYDLAYEEARSKLKSVLRELIVDLNYEIFTVDSSVLKPRVNGFISTALGVFHERSEK
jgi:hypothetical protein